MKNINSRAGAIADVITDITEVSIVIRISPINMLSVFVNILARVLILVISDLKIFLSLSM